MNFTEIAINRQSCRSYGESRAVEQVKLEAILRTVQLAPSACNGQPYHLTVCRGETAKAVAAACTGVGLNKFAVQAPILIVISEMPYVKSTAPSTSVSPRLTSPPKPPLRVCPPVSSAGWMTLRSAPSAIFSIPSDWSSH